MISPGALVPVTEYVTCRGLAGAGVVGGGAAVVVAGGASAVVVAGGGVAVLVVGGGSVVVVGGGGGGGSVAVGGGGGGSVGVRGGGSTVVNGGGGEGVVMMISSCIGGVDVGAIPGEANSLVSVRANSSDTDITRAIAATIAATPTTHGHRGAVGSSPVDSA
jgi:hypothetical protein